MKKKDIYEHLANIYLEAASTKKNKVIGRKKFSKGIYIGVISLISMITFSAMVLHNRNLAQNKKLSIASERALVMQSNIIKINFNFNPATKEIYSMDLNKLDLRAYKSLAFAVRKSDFDHKIIMKVEFTNSARQASEYYITNLKSYKWQNYRIDFSDFKNIADWSQMANLSFVIEEWNTPKKNGVVYIDNIRFVE